MIIKNLADRCDWPHFGHATLVRIARRFQIRMAPPFLIDSAQIVGLFMETLLYGVFLVTLVQCLYALLWSPVEHHFKKHFHWPMLVAAILMFTFATLDVAFGLRHNLDAFVYYKGPGGATEELENISYWVNVMKTADYVAQTCIGDAILIYRCYIVWGKKWMVIIPSFMLWLGGSTCGAILTYTFATLNKAALIDTASATPWVDSMIALTLSMNILTTSLIVFRIWRVDKQTSGMMATASTARSRRVTRLKSIMRILVDSAALYTVSVIIFVATYIAGSNANYGTSDNVVQIIGICFNMIIIRVNSHEASQVSTTANATGTAPLKLRVPGKKSDTAVSSFPLSTFHSQMGDSDISTSKPSGLQVNGSRDVDFSVDMRGPIIDKNRQGAWNEV
ncbi:hypothetical protein B0H10DRAFT_2133542 [Mycena sp. CBHHK59/15]|nr:hypothetical protein B0H10DRAFT_2133542 [Mycena sp. CBHHK59/15]